MNLNVKNNNNTFETALLVKLYFQTLLLDLSKCVDRLFELFTALYNWGEKKYRGEGQPCSLFRPFRALVP